MDEHVGTDVCAIRPDEGADVGVHPHRSEQLITEADRIEERAVKQGLQVHFLPSPVRKKQLDAALAEQADGHDS